MKRLVLIIIILLNINKSSAQAELIGGIITEIISSSLYPAYEKSKHRIELTKIFNNYSFYGNLIDSTRIDSIVENNLGVGIEVDAYFMQESNKKHIPRLSVMAIDSLQGQVFIHSKYIEKITSIDEERIDNTTSGVRYIDREILYEKGLGKFILASRNEDLYRKREKAKKRDEFMKSPKGLMAISCAGAGLFFLAAIYQSSW